jgi:hypothetical protein
VSERTAPSLASIDALLPQLKALPASAARERLIEDTEALRRAVDAFHMEAIRFRMHTVDRDLMQIGDPAALRAMFDQLRQTLEAAGFHTRSHTAP